MKTFLPFSLRILLLIFSVNGTLLAQSVGDFRTATSAVVWNTAAHWQTWSGTLWNTASSAPSSTNNVYIQASHTITLDANSSCKNLYISTGTIDATTGFDGQLALADYELSINGKLSCYYGLINITPLSVDFLLINASSTIPASPITKTANSSSGRIKFVGNSRTITSSGEWSASNTGATSTFDIEIAMNSGQTATMVTAIKAYNWIFISGTLDAGSTTISADNGTSGQGDVTINNGATLISAQTGTSTQVISRTSSTRMGTFTVNTGGTLQVSGLTPAIDANAITNNGTIIFNRAGNQTFLSRGSDGSSAFIDSYSNITLSGSGTKTTVASRTTTVSGTLSLQGTSAMALGSSSVLNYGTSAILEYAGSAAQSSGGEWPGNIAPTYLTINNSSGVTLNTAGTLSNTLTLTAGSLTQSAALTLGTGATIIRSGGSLVTAPVFGSSVNVSYVQHSGSITSGNEIPSAVGVLNNLTIGSTNGVTLGATTSVNGALSFGNVNNTTLTTGGNLVLKSSSAGTSRIADMTNSGVNSGNTISGTAIAERYIPDDGQRAWRLLSGLLTSGQTIRQAWQENGASGATNPNIGTYITSRDYTDGFDSPVTNSSSILMHSQGGVTGPSWTTRPVTSTNVAIANEQGYMLYVRGDRNATPTNSLHAPTVLRTAGTLKQGTQSAITISSTGTGYTLVGNPYASPIDFEQIRSTTNLAQYFMIWDANLSGIYGLGGFRLVERNNDGTYQQTPVVLTGTATNNTMRYIHSGQAFFLKTTGTAGTTNASVVFTESCKSSSLPSINPFTPVSADQQIIANIFAVNTGNILSLADGMRVRYDISYSVTLDDDIAKISNFSENLASLRDGRSLIVEKRPMITVSDTVFFNMTRMKIKSYQLQITAMDFVQTNVTGILQDNFLNTGTPLNLTGTTTINFDVTSVSGSSASDRFRIVFTPVTVLPLTISSIKAYQQANNITVEWKVENETGISKYEVERSADGRMFGSVATKSATGNIQSAVTYSWVDINALPGNNFYRIKSTGVDGRVSYSTVVKIYMGKSDPSVTVYPNPVTDGIIHLQMNNMPKGIYHVRMVNNLGQVLLTEIIDHAGGSSTRTITPANRAKGIYQFEVTNAGEIKMVNEIMFK